MQRLKAKRRRPVFTPFTSNPPAAAFLQNIITQSNLQKANLHFWDHPCPNSSWFIQEKLWKISHQKNWWTFTKKNTKPFLKREREIERDISFLKIFYGGGELNDFWWGSDISLSGPRGGISRRGPLRSFCEIILILCGAFPHRRADTNAPSIPFTFTFHFSLFTFTFPHRRADTNAHSIPFTFHFSPFIVHFSLSLLHTIAQIQMPLPSLSLSLFTFHFHFSTPSRRYKRPFHPRSIQKITFAQLCWRKRRWNGERDRKGKTFPSIQYQFKSTS